MNSTWVNLWLSYVHIGKDVCPHPGPCRNDDLLQLNDETWLFTPKDILKLDTARASGDYRRVNATTWNTYCELYPGTGPAITTTFIEVHIVVGSAREGRGELDFGVRCITTDIILFCL